MKSFTTKIVPLAVVALLCASLVFAPSVVAAGIGITWTPNSGQGSAATEWNGVAWSPQLAKFVAVAQDAPPYVMTSPDGVNWQGQTGILANVWTDVTWAAELGIFVAVAGNGAQPVMTSPDGENWTPHTAANGGWTDVVWAPEIGKFVAVGTDLDAIMTSTNGTDWTPHTPPEANLWESVTWAPELGLFVAVSWDGTNRVMTSPDGENWTPHTAPGDSAWWSVAWSPHLGIFVAVATNGTDRIMTSTNGADWTIQTAPVLNSWEDVIWVPELKQFVAVGGATTNGSMVSSDGVNWTPYPAAGDGVVSWEDVAWSPELGRLVVVSVGTTDRVAVGVPQPTMLGAPPNLQAMAAGSSEIHLSWGAATGDNPYSPPTGYKIERSVAGGSFEVLVANTNSPATTFQDTGLTPSTQYTYRVSAINGAGVGVASNVASATTRAQDSLAPTGSDLLTYLLLGTIFMAVSSLLVWSYKKQSTLT